MNQKFAHLIINVVNHYLEKWRGLWKMQIKGFLGGTVVKNPPANAGDPGSSPGPGRSHRPQSN